ncbi:hypothetical protein EJ06DRAFT_177330 [Trichodelitschia bisporula]|uniref:Uncharacterized protein n=1 Tax=Trichodelitschia bisporula TaxID=703511 RepID=A0A6G1HM33_9PEZI|nr:hypothetical protein EJ06DRAFT_177330 [Trichodelitschia bisporula]
MARVKPNCTHIKMDICFTDDRCDLCGRNSPFRWLYECKQDEVVTVARRQQLRTLRDTFTSPPTSVIAELQSLGFSESVIDQARNGHYTPAEIEKLKNQKLHLQKTIDKQMQTMRAGHNRSSSSATSSLQPEGVQVAETQSTLTVYRGTRPNITVYNGNPRRTSLSMVQRHASIRRNSEALTKCNRKFCQYCRFYYKDRAFQSFGAVFAGEVQPPTFEPPISDVNVVRNLGLKKETFVETVTNICAQYDSADSESTDDVFQDFDESPQDFVDHADPMLSQLALSDQLTNLELEYSHNSRFANRRESTEEDDSGNDISPETLRANLQRMFRTFAPNDVGPVRDSPVLASASPEQISHVMVTVADKGKETLQPTNAESTPASEIEVDGGLALTEEAVEMQTPDLITQV